MDADNRGVVHEEVIHEIEETDSESRLPPFPRPWRHPVRATAWIVRTLFGLASLTFLMAVVAAIPVVNFLALGYLLEVEGRVARSGKLRSGLPLLNVAPRIGSIALGMWLWIIPVRLLAGAAADARLIDPGSTADRGLHIATAAAWGLVTVHLCLALARGGSLGCFFRPLKNFLWLARRMKDGDYLATASFAVREFTSRLRLKHHFWLGLRGYLGAFAWLVLPTLLFATARESRGGPVFITLCGGVLLVPVLAWVPFLQARVATENRLGAIREIGAVRRLFCHAPLAWLLAVIVIYVLALPLYLFKSLLPPSDAMWGITLIFIVSIYPARLVTGWAYGRALRRQSRGLRSHFLTRWSARLLMLPLLSVFVLLLYFTQFIGEKGKLVLFEHHAFLLPVPF